MTWFIDKLGPMPPRQGENAARPSGMGYTDAPVPPAASQRPQAAPPAAAPRPQAAAPKAAAAAPAPAPEPKKEKKKGWF